MTYPPDGPASPDGTNPVTPGPAVPPHQPTPMPPMPYTGPGVPPPPKSGNGRVVLIVGVALAALFLLVICGGIGVFVLFNTAAESEAPAHQESAQTQAEPEITGTYGAVDDLCTVVDIDGYHDLMAGKAIEEPITENLSDPDGAFVDMSCSVRTEWDEDDPFLLYDFEIEAITFATASDAAAEYVEERDFWMNDLDFIDRGEADGEWDDAMWMDHGEGTGFVSRALMVRHDNLHLRISLSNIDSEEGDDLMFNAALDVMDGLLR